MVNDLQVLTLKTYLTVGLPKKNVGYFSVFVALLFGLFLFDLMFGAHFISLPSSFSTLQFCS